MRPIVWVYFYKMSPRYVWFFPFSQLKTPTPLIINASDDSVFTWWCSGGFLQASYAHRKHGLAAVAKARYRHDVNHDHSAYRYCAT